MPYIKCNFDASFNVQDLKATGGWMLRNHNHNGTPEHWGSMILDHTSTPLEAEKRLYWQHFNKLELEAIHMSSWKEIVKL